MASNMRLTPPAGDEQYTFVLFAVMGPVGAANSLYPLAPHLNTLVFASFIPLVVRRAKDEVARQTNR